MYITIILYNTTRLSISSQKKKKLLYLNGNQKKKNYEKKWFYTLIRN